MKFSIRNRTYFTNNRKLDKLIGNKIFSNFFAEYGLFLITKNEVGLATEQQMILNKKPHLFAGTAKTALANNTDSY
jgi:hypothetical protein